MWGFLPVPWDFPTYPASFSFPRLRTLIGFRFPLTHVRSISNHLAYPCSGVHTVVFYTGWESKKLVHSFVYPQGSFWPPNLPERHQALDSPRAQFLVLLARRQFFHKQIVEALLALPTIYEPVKCKRYLTFFQAKLAWFPFSVDLEDDFDQFGRVPASPILLEHVNLAIVVFAGHVEDREVRMLLFGDREVAGAVDIEVIRRSLVEFEVLFLKIGAFLDLRVLLIQCSPISGRQRSFYLPEGPFVVPLRMKCLAFRTIFLVMHRKRRKINCTPPIRVFGPLSSLRGEHFLFRLTHF